MSANVEAGKCSRCDRGVHERFTYKAAAYQGWAFYEELCSYRRYIYKDVCLKCANIYMKRFLDKVNEYEEM